MRVVAFVLAAACLVGLSPVTAAPYVFRGRQQCYVDQAAVDADWDSRMEFQGTPVATLATVLGRPADTYCAVFEGIWNDTRSLSRRIEVVGWQVDLDKAANANKGWHVTIRNLSLLATVFHFAQFGIVALQCSAGGIPCRCST